MTRVGRFAEIDPRKGHGLPSLLRVAGVLAWAGLMFEAFRRARATAASPDSASGSGDDG